MNEQTQSLETLQDIRRLMNRSSRFLSLSGLSGIAAGVWGLIGSWAAGRRIGAYYDDRIRGDYRSGSLDELLVQLLLLAILVFALAVASAFFFTWRRARKQRLPLWDRTSRQLAVNLLIPLVTGGLFIGLLLLDGSVKMVGLIAPLCLIFYGLALVNGSKYTVNDIRYLGVLEILLGLIATRYVGYGLYFWAIGFGALHIIYGFFMWWKNERGEAPDAA